MLQLLFSRNKVSTLSACLNTLHREERDSCFVLVLLLRVGVLKVLAHLVVSLRSAKRSQDHSKKWLTATVKKCADFERRVVCQVIVDKSNDSLS